MYRKPTYETVKKYINIESNSGCLLLTTEEEYNNIKYISKETLKIKCGCGEIVNKRWNKFFNAKQHKCLNCYKNKKPSYDKVKEYINKLGYKLLTPFYKNKKEVLTLECPIGHLFLTTFDNFKNTKSRCPKCNFKRRRISKESVKDIIKKENYQLLSEYKNTRSIITLKCPKGHIYKVKATSFIHDNKRCPICDKSRGETKIENILQSLNESYEHEKSFPNCMSRKNNPLRFDFYLKEKNICIEYDGKQHYELVTFGSNDIKKCEKNFIIRKENDKIKNEYCNKNGITLIRIPYWDYKNIETILINNL